MKKTAFYKNCAFVAAVIAICAIGLSFKTIQTKWTEKSAAKWVKSKKWAGGLKLKADPSINAVTFAEQYHANPAMWDKAFAFLKEQKLEDLAPGKYPIDGDNVYASVTEGPSKTFEKSAWESHKKYIDLQHVIKGQEKIGVAPLDSTTVTEAYNEAKDIAHYNAGGKFYLATPDNFFLFFPNDAHRPNIIVDGYAVVKKIVIKIKVSN